MTSAGDLVQSREVVLFDFDGPICRLFSGISDREAADALRSELNGPLPVAVQQTSDPFDVLKFAVGVDRAAGARVEQRFREIEREAVQIAAPTIESARTIRQLRTLGHRLAVVSNNSSSAIDLYLAEAGLLACFEGVYGRDCSEVSRLKPSPYLLHRAVVGLRTAASKCVFVGDSVTDMEAAQAAGIAAVGFVNRPTKAVSLATAGASVLISRMDQMLPA